MHPETKYQRNLIDFAKEEFLKRCEIDPNTDLEKSAEIFGFKLKTLFANIPFPEIYQTTVEEYEQKIVSKEI